MKIILSPMCESITGSLGSGFGYHIQRRKNGFFGKRNTKGIVPPDGHLSFILTCAELAQNRLHIADVCVKRDEVVEALREAGKHVVAAYITAYKEAFPTVLRKDDIINIKNNYNL